MYRLTSKSYVAKVDVAAPGTTCRGEGKRWSKRAEIKIGIEYKA